ncbi:MAG TPA: type II 3-dehydroquinate dehydratase [Solirubrobacteraceae bacterium]|jgi:3-dehydroquinate dehydratase-2|nr:type II 3-dehydroquinate dehydratase [Solirubrobacteraceae bacterium]
MTDAPERIVTRNRVEVMHGVNLDQLGRRDPALYGSLTLLELERRIEERSEALGLRASFFHSNHEGEFVERLHAAREEADAILLNPGAWTHYSWAIRDALEIASLPTVEVHLSDVQAREPWRRVSVIGELCFATVSGRGAGGYDEALALLRERLEDGAS